MIGDEISDQSTYLSILTATPVNELKTFVETLLPHLADVEVISSRTGLVMLPFVDSVKGVTFHLGETLLAEAEVKAGGCVGYAVCLGRDLEQAIAIAILDALMQSAEPGVLVHRTAMTEFIARAAIEQHRIDLDLLRKIESTRVELETF